MAPETPGSTSKSTVITNGSHNLKIQGFSSIKGMGLGKYISSGTFSVGGHLWEIQFFPDGKNKDESGGDIYVSLFITLVSKFEKDFKVWFEYVLLDQSGDKWYKSTSGFSRMRKMCGPYAVVNDSKTTIMPFGFTPFFKRTELEASQFMNDDCLTIQCTVCVANTSMDSPKPFAQPLPLSNLGQCYGQLLESKNIYFEVEGEMFYANKLILSARSPVFKAQFFGALKEENTRCIKIEGMQAPVFKALLFFISFGVIPDLDSNCATPIMTQHLLAAADRYGIERLKSLCELRLCENITINNVALTLDLAEQHLCFRLKSRCFEFIGLPGNLEAVMQTDGFKNLKENCPAVIYELLKFVAVLRYFFEPSIKRESFSCYRGVARICGSAKRLLFDFLLIK